jgi:hypothetical protein
LYYSTLIPTGNNFGFLANFTWSEELGIFCGCDFNSNIAFISPDGINWNTYATVLGAARNPFITLWAPDLRLFLASGSTVAARTMGIITSPNGITWTTRVTPSLTSSTWQWIEWSPDIKVLIAVPFSQGLIGRSIDGINWSTYSTPNSSLTRCLWVSYLKLFVVTSIAGSSRIMTSPDGITWVSRTTSSFSWRGITSSPELRIVCVIADDATNRVTISSDAITWSTYFTNINTGWNNILWNPQLSIFCAVSNGFIQTSLNGINWTTFFAYTNGFNVVTNNKITLFSTSSSSSSFLMTTPLPTINKTNRIGTNANSETELFGRTINIGPYASYVNIGTYSQTTAPILVTSTMNIYSPMYVPNVPFAQLKLAALTTNANVPNSTNTIVGLAWTTTYLTNMNLISGNYLQVIYPGIYVSSITLAWTINAAGSVRMLAQAINNISNNFYYGMNAVRPAQSYGTVMTSNAMFYLNSGDIVYPVAFQDSGVTFTVGNLNDSTDRCIWTMHKISG